MQAQPVVDQSVAIRVRQAVGEQARQAAELLLLLFECWKVGLQERRKGEGSDAEGRLAEKLSAGHQELVFASRIH